MRMPPRRTTRSLTALSTLLATAVAGVVTLAAPASAEEVTVGRGDGHTIRVVGHGYGHGHGLSQHGAQGAALQGLGWRQIVEFYYPGTTWARAGGAIKVRITGDTTSDVVVVERAGLRVRELGSGTTTRLPDRGTERWRLQPSGGRTAVQFLRNGRWRTWAELSGAVDIWAPGGTGLVTPAGTTAYRGRLRAVDGMTVNALRLEHYLRGVVPQEVPALWEPDAVRAQSVAARTYAARERRDRGGSWDVYDTTASQVYGGIDAEHPASDEAIRATRREVLHHQGVPAFTQFSASSGGWTAGSSGHPYLVTRKDPYDDWTGNTHHDWRVTTRDGVLESRFPAVGELRSISVDRAGRTFRRGGRAVRVTLRGTRGAVTVSGDDVRWRLGLRSTWFRFAVVD